MKGQIQLKFRSRKLTLFTVLLWLSVANADSGKAPGEVTPEPSLPEAENVVANKFVPAMLRRDAFSLINNLGFPEGDEDVGILVRCIVGVERNGRIRNGFFYCINGNDETLDYERKVSDAIRYSKMKPAQLDGRRTHVTMSFSVAFERVDGIEKTVIFPNHLTNLEVLGSEYIAPQLIHKSVKQRSPACALERVARLRVSVEGKVLHSQIEASDVSKACRRYVEKYFNSLRFIPGHFGSEPIEMEFLYYLRPLVGYV